jgi:hypothetical protein
MTEGLSLVLDYKKYIHTLGCVQCLRFQYPYWWFPRLFRQFSSLVVIQRVSFVHYLHLMHVRDARGSWS